LKPDDELPRSCVTREIGAVIEQRVGEADRLTATPIRQRAFAALSSGELATGGRAAGTRPA
jgi:hypothetical protein